MVIAWPFLLEDLPLLVEGKRGSGKIGCRSPIGTTTKAKLGAARSHVGHAKPLGDMTFGAQLCVAGTGLDPDPRNGHRAGGLATPDRPDHTLPIVHPS